MPTLDLAAIKTMDPGILCVGSHPGIIQSIMDFDYLLGRTKPTIKAVIASGRRNERYFFGKNEVLVPVYESPEALPDEISKQVNLFLSLVSGRRVLSSTKQIMNSLPNLVGGTVFAERVP